MITRADVDKILDLFPMDVHGTGHIADCGYDANDERCGCSTLPERIGGVLAALLRDREDAARREGGATERKRIERAEALLSAWEHDAPGLVDPTFVGRMREVLRRDPAPVRLRDRATAARSTRGES